MRFIAEFRKFALRGNVIDLVIGFTVGVAFTTVVKSIVDDIVMPPVGLLLGRADFSDLFIVLKEGPDPPPRPYATLQDAQNAGAVTLNYGRFINSCVAFLIVAVAMFVLVRGMNKLDDRIEERFAGDKPKPSEPDNKKCPHCRSTIPYKATRCAFCTSHLEQAEAEKAAAP